MLNLTVRQLMIWNDSSKPMHAYNYAVIYVLTIIVLSGFSENVMYSSFVLRHSLLYAKKHITWTLVHLLGHQILFLWNIEIMSREKKDRILCSTRYVSIDWQLSYVGWQLNCQLLSQIVCTCCATYHKTLNGV